MKFRFSPDFVIDSDEEPWCREGLRALMVGGPGSGKSWNNSLLAEQFLTQGGTVVIFQPRDEYYTLKEKFDVLSVGGVHAKDMEFALTSPKIYAKAVVEDGVSMIFYTSGLDEEKLVDWVARFIHHLMTLQEVHKRPLLIIVEETHEYAPLSAKGHVAPPWVFNRMIKALKDCFTQGRKLNISAVASSQRPQELNFTIRQLANLSFYGKFAAQDISYIDRECLKYVRKRIEVSGDEVTVTLLDASRLLTLKAGEWLIITGARARYVTVTEKRITKHGAETPSLEYVAPRATKTKKSVDELGKAVAEALRKEEAEKSELEKANRKIRELSKKLEAAEEQARIKLSVKELLQGGVSDAELAEKLAQEKAANKTLRESLKKSKEAAEQLGFEVKDLRRFKQIGEDADALRQAFIKFLRLNDAARPGFEPGAAVPSDIVLEHEVPLILVEVSNPVLKVSESTWQGRLLSLVTDGFFDSPRKLGDVQRELDRVFATKGRSATVSNELAALCPLRILQRKQESGSWSYSVVPFAKERIEATEEEASN